jgi:hypothetical protein
MQVVHSRTVYVFFLQMSVSAFHSSRYRFTSDEHTLPPNSASA